MSSSNINTRGRNSPPPGFHHDEFPAQPFHMVRVSCDWALIDTDFLLTIRKEGLRMKENSHVWDIKCYAVLFWTLNIFHSTCFGSYIRLHFQGDKFCLKKNRIQVLCKLFREWISLLFLWSLRLKLHFDTYSKTQPRINFFSSYISPLTTLKISLVILLTIWHAVFLMLVWRIWCWINLQSPNWYVSLFLLFYCMFNIVLIFWGKFHLGHSQKF